MTASGHHKCRNCGLPFVGRANSKYCSPGCKLDGWRKRERAARMAPDGSAPMSTTDDPVTLFVYPPDVPWDAEGRPLTEVLVPVADADAVEALPRPQHRELPEGQVQRLDGRTVVVFDMLSGSRWTVRLAQCGAGPCCCALQGWPAGWEGTILPPDPFDAWSFHATTVNEYRRLRRLEAVP